MNTVLARRFPATDMSLGLVLTLVAIGVPRTVLADLGVVPPNSGLAYYVLALAPFVVWLAVALVRRSRRPFADFVVVGALYGLTLVAIHQALWGVGRSWGYRPPAAAFEFAERFGPEWYDLAARGYTCGVAMMIGLGSGVVVAVVASIASRARGRANQPA
ncbi:hypothetical protein G5C66_03595 [Nocardioides sp. KC13]|uniref:Uncharacterized protein n=1 Tax=Nocardioides turkmenicus TaxID=2711220 RepID=A0A6M1QQ13_9ACTN|nr:hypothetical protein [Nocardioides sp. KC13]NGN91825.1 hypothetical protein [Nocardioides sp. KC13]